MSKIIAGFFVVASTLCYANVPAGSKFRAIAYDSHTRHFIAVGNTSTNDIVAVSADGRTWAYHNIITPGSSRANGKNFNTISVNTDGDIYLVGPAADIVVRRHTEPENNWTFTKVVVPAQTGETIGEPYVVNYPENFQTGQTGLAGFKRKSSMFYLARVGDTALRQIIRLDFMFDTTGGMLVQSPHIIKTGADIEGISLETSNPNSEGFSSSLIYRTTEGDLYKSVNDSSTFLKLTAQGLRGGLSWEFPPVTQEGLPILTTTYANEQLEVCDVDPLGGATTVRCAAVATPASLHGISSSQVDLASALPASPATSNQSMPAVVAMSDASDDRGVAVVYGTIVNGVFTYRGSSPLHDVANRTCIAGNGADGNITVMLGSDNKALLSTNGGTQWQIVNM